MAVVTCGSVVKLLNTRHNVRLHSHDVRYGSGTEGDSPLWVGCLGRVSLEGAGPRSLRAWSGKVSRALFLEEDDELPRKLSPNVSFCLMSCGPNVLHIYFPVFNIVLRTDTKVIFLGE